jgi:hypothetical protein
VLERTDLEEASSLARESDDGTLLASTFVELCAVARQRYDRESAKALARDAYDAAAADAAWPVAHAAVMEAMLLCCAWWDIKAAVQLAGTSTELAQRCGDVEQANHYNLVALLSYVRGLYADANTALSKAAKGGFRASPSAAVFNFLMTALVALAERRWAVALDAVDRLDAVPETEPVRELQQTVSAVRIVAYILRAEPGDAERATNAAAHIDAHAQTVFPWNVPHGVVAACVGGLLQHPDSPERLKKALDLAEERADKMPFDADLAYVTLEKACRAAGNSTFEARAALRREYYEELRKSRVAEASTAAPLSLYMESRISEAMPRTSS